MSYRVSLDNFQIFGNGESYDEWDEFIKSQGIAIDEEGCYDGEITDVMGIFVTIDKIIRRLQKEFHERVAKQDPEEVKRYREAGKTRFIHHEMTDFSDSMFLAPDTPWLEFNLEMINGSYCFLPYQVLQAIKPKIEKVHYDSHKDYKINGVDWWYCYYQIKPGMTIHVHAS